MVKILNTQRWLFEWRYWRGQTPWDTRITPPEVVEFLESAAPGRALDLGCGTGTNAIELARRGWQVTGVDFVPKAIRSARRRAFRAGVEIDLRVGDVTDLSDLVDPYDYVLDIGCLHALVEPGQKQYAAGLVRLIRQGGRYMLYAWLPRSWRGESRGLDLEKVGALFAPAFQVTRTELGEEQGAGAAWHWLVRV